MDWITILFYAIQVFGGADTTKINMSRAILHHEYKLPVPDDSGLATRYGIPGDKWVAGPLACGDGSQTIWDAKNVCAHRHLPCGTILIVENIRTGGRTWCRVMDRGPYGAYIYEGTQRKWVVKKRRSDPGEWRGILDMTQDVSLAIGHNGFEKVRIWSEPRLRKIWEKDRPKQVS